MKVKFLIIFILATGSAYTYYHFFNETLMFSEIVGQSKDVPTNLLVGMFDFDTGLTRYDLYHLSGKSKEWLARMKQIDRIPDPTQRQQESEKLMAEMLQDHSFKKVAKKLFELGMGVTKLFLKVLV